MGRPDAARWGWFLALVLGAAVILIVGRRGPADGQAVVGAPGGDAPMETFAGIPPLAWLVERIGGDHVHVEVLVQPGREPHTFEPTPRQVMALGRARLFFKVGMPFESRLVERMARGPGGLTVVDATEGIVKRTMVEDHDEDAAGPDPHVWLSPPLLRTMAANVASALAGADPFHAADYRRRQADLATQIDAVHARIQQRLAPFRGQRFYVFHPAFGYFAEAYHLVQEPVEIEGKSPTPRQLFALVRQARSDGVRVIFLQPQFDPSSARAVARAIGGVVLPLDDLAKDVLVNLSDMAEKIAAADSNR